VVVVSRYKGGTFKNLYMYNNFRKLPLEHSIRQKAVGGRLLLHRPILLTSLGTIQPPRFIVFGILSSGSALSNILSHR
jgi:hypothetical protein